MIHYIVKMISLRVHFKVISYQTATRVFSLPPVGTYSCQDLSTYRSCAVDVNTHMCDHLVIPRIGLVRV